MTDYVKQSHPSRLIIGLALIAGLWGWLWAIRAGADPVFALGIPLAALILASLGAWIWTRRIFRGR